jgi:tetratricopeptide (TPR) repeat protein
VKAAPAPATYTLKSIEKMLGLGRGVIASIVNAGFVTPSRGARNEYRFSFQDVVLLRTAHDLMAANIPSRRMLRSLKRLKAKLPKELPLSGLRIAAIGSDVVVRDGDAQWEAESGQLLIDFEIAHERGAVTFLKRGPEPAEDAVADADVWFARGEALEADDAAAAEKAYRRALEYAPDHTDAYVNLGALLCEAGRWAEAVKLYDVAIRYCPQAPLLYFNRGIALEERHRYADALKSYERCLELAPDLADAHYNAARLYEQSGQAQKAVRHYSAYRRLQ